MESIQETTTTTEKRDINPLTQRLFMLLSLVLPPFGWIFFVRNIKYKSRRVNCIGMLALSLALPILGGAFLVDRVANPGKYGPIVSSDKYVDAVRNGTLNAFPGKTLGLAFDAHLKNTKWEHIVATDGKHYVNISGSFAYAGGTPLPVVLQYAINTEAVAKRGSIGVRPGVLG